MSQPAKRLSALLEQMLRELNEDGSCCLCIDAANSTHLLLSKLHPREHEGADLIADEAVPVVNSGRCVDLANIKRDLTTHQILPHIDGVTHVKNIAEMIDVDTSIVKKCLQTLWKYDLIHMIPVFKYSATKTS